MRIALVSHMLPPASRGGAEAYVADLALALARTHEVTVLSGVEAEIGPLRSRALPRRPPLPRSQAAKAWWHLREQWMLSVHRALLAELRRLQPDVVHTHECQGLSAAVFTAIAHARVGHVHTAHDLNILCVRTSMTRGGAFCGGGCASCRVQRVIRGGAVRRHLHRLVAPSDFIRERHLEAGIVPPERAVTIRQGSATGTPRLRSRDDGSLTLGYIGALAAHKGVATLLRAFAAAPAGWRLLVAGTGPLEPAVAAAARADPRIEALGHVAGAAKEAFFDAVDVLVIPSEWEEPAPLVAAEAGVRGIPTVVSDRGGLPEEPLSRVFRAGDAEQLRAAAAWYATPPARLGETSRRLLDERRRFTWAHHLEQLEPVLADAASYSSRSR